MIKKIMWISTSQLKVGMFVDRDVKMNDIMLVRAGTPLSAAHLRSLRRWNVTRVSIEAAGEVVAGFHDPSTIIDHPEKAKSTFSDETYFKEKSRLDALYRNVQDDKQMLMIKMCVLNHIEDVLRGK